MKLEAFLAHVRKGLIPPEPPDGTTLDGCDWPKFETRMVQWDARAECTKRGMWAIIDLRWTRALARWIGKRQVLEIMAGPGWLAKALHAHGTAIIATDNGSWDDRHSEAVPIFSISKMDATAAVKANPNAEILLVSWPPYGSDAICDACAAWGNERPIIYIGEGYGGCNAPDEFFTHFKEDENIPHFPLMSWYGLHDYVYVGYYE